jgi:hypothetical protein
MNSRMYCTICVCKRETRSLSFLGILTSRKRAKQSMTTYICQDSRQKQVIKSLYLPKHVLRSVDPSQSKILICQKMYPMYCPTCHEPATVHLILFTCASLLHVVQPATISTMHWLLTICMWSSGDAGTQIVP